MQDFSLYQFIYVYVHVLFESFWVSTTNDTSLTRKGDHARSLVLKHYTYYFLKKFKQKWVTNKLSFFLWVCKDFFVFVFDVF